MLNLNESQTLILYTIIFLLSISIGSIYQKKILKSSKVFSFSNRIAMILVIFFPVLIASIRYEVGTDFFNYYFYFFTIRNYSIFDILFNEADPLYGILNKFADLFFGDAWGIFFLSSFFTLFITLKALEHYRKVISISFALLIYYCLFYGLTLNIVRQMIAVAIVFYCYIYIIEKQPFKYIIGLLIASLFHISSLFLLPLYFLKNSTGFKYKQILFLMIILTSPIYVYLVTIFMLNLEISKFATSYSFDFSTGGIGFLIWILPTLIPIFIFKKRALSIEPKYEPLFSIYLLQIPLSYLGYFSVHASRMAYYSSIVEVVLIPLIIRCLPNRSNKILVAVYFVFWYIFKFIFQFFINGGAEIFPYKTQ